MKLLLKYSSTIVFSLTACIFLSHTQAAVQSTPKPLQDTTYIWIPNAFSPDGDGLNDEYRITTNKKLYGYQMTILNIWGERLFYTTKVADAWDGTYKDAPVPRGVYVYVIKYREELRGLPITHTGPLHLIR